MIFNRNNVTNDFFFSKMATTFAVTLPLMKMPYNAEQIARHILTMSKPEVGDVISNLKLQKLLYYTQGFSLALNEEPVFKEDIIAWQYGPVVPAVYHTYKEAGHSGIVVQDYVLDISTPTIELIKEVYDTYGQFSALRLMNMTHEEPPWKGTPINGVISHDLMHSYFKTLVY